MFYNTSAEFQRQAFQSVSEGLEEAQKTGVYAINPLLYNQGVISSLNEGNPGRAEEFLLKPGKDRPKRQPYASRHYFYLSACHYLCIGKMDQAIFSAKKGLDLVRETGVPVSEVLVRLVLSHALHETGNEDEANQELAEPNGPSCRRAAPILKYLYYLTEAYFEYARKNEARGPGVSSKGNDTRTTEGVYNTPLFLAACGHGPSLRKSIGSRDRGRVRADSHPQAGSGSR